MAELDSLLFQVFERLRRQGVPLGVSDYLEAIETIQAGVGLEDAESLKGLCRLLWTKSREDQELFDLAFAELVEPQLSTISTPESNTSNSLSTAPESSTTLPESSSESELEEVPESQQERVALPSKSMNRSFMLKLELSEDSHHYQLTPRLPISRRDMAGVWRQLHRPQRVGVPEELREYKYLLNSSRVLAQILYKNEPIILQSLKQENTSQQVENREPMLISPVLVKKLTDSSSSSFNQETTLSSSFNQETTLSSSFNQETTLDEQLLYAHLLDCVEVESPDALIDRFRRLFIDDVEYPNPHVWQALKRIVDSNLAEREFKFILNRCCYIPINRWVQQPQFQSSIPKLISLFETAPAGLASSKTRHRLHQIVQHFPETEQYKALQRLAQVISGESEGDSKALAKPLSTLIHRYSYLYEHCLLSEDSSYEQQQTVRQIQSRIQQRFELDLSQYVTYQVRRAQALRKQSLDELDKIIQPVNNPTLQPVNNPTLLSDRELGAALKQFVGKVQGSYTYRDVAQSFLTHISKTTSYKAFKDDLYEYLTASIDPVYGKHQFNARLYTHLNNILPYSDSQKPNEFLVVRTCSQLLNFLVVESPQRPNHFIFVDLITNLDATLTTCLLLKIVLICRKVKPYLDKRFSILFNHYESATRDGVPWLVKSLENWNIAASVHFGSANLSSLNSIM